MKSVLLALAALAAALFVVAFSPRAVLAQEDSGSHSVTFDGHTLDFPHALTNAVSVIVYDQPVPNDNGLEQPPRILVRLGGVEYASFPLGVVEIYRLDQAVGFQAAESFAQLRQLLEERPGLDEYLLENQLLPTAYPYLETDNSVYTFSTKAAYFESEDYTGVTSINARIYFLSSGAVFMRYNLEALSKDGQWGISAHFDLRADYPETLEALGDPDRYTQEVIAFLQETPEAQFTPPLSLIDQVFATIRQAEQ